MFMTITLVSSPDAPKNIIYQGEDFFKVPHPPCDEILPSPTPRSAKPNTLRPSHLRRVGPIVVDTTGRWSGIPGHPTDGQQGKGHHLLTKGHESKALAISYAFHRSVRIIRFYD